MRLTHAGLVLLFTLSLGALAPPLAALAPAPQVAGGGASGNAGST